MNPAVTYFVPSKPDPGETTLYSGQALTVKGASAEHMLAMKIRSHREIDLSDAKTLVDRLKLTSTREIQQIAEDAYEGHGDNSRIVIQEGLERIAEAMPNLTTNHIVTKTQKSFLPPDMKAIKNGTGAKTPTPQRPSARNARVPDGTSKARTKTEYYPQ